MSFAELINKVHLFYYLATMNEDNAIECAQRTLQRVNRNEVNSLRVAELVQLCENGLNRLHLKSKVEASRSKPIQVPDVINLAIWKDMIKKSNREELSALVWTRILGFSEAEVAQGMAVSVGTVRHRVNRGMKTLAFVMQGESK